VVLLFVLTSLAAARLTRLLVRDQFPPVAVQRARVAARWGDESWQSYLANCSWCAGVYVSAGVTFCTWLTVDHLPVPVWWFLGVAMMVGLLAAVDVALERD
jgi:hypothetical protein